MKKLVAIAALGLPLLASAQVTNGSFEATPGLSGWTVSGGGSYAPSVIAYGAGAAFGEAVAAPAGGGAHGLYFVDDSATQTVTTVLGAGVYDWSFQWYLPANGWDNERSSTLELIVDGSAVWTQTIEQFSPVGAQTWLTASSAAPITVASGSTIGFRFLASGGGDATDVVVDNLQVTPVPEPETFALMAAGLAAVGFLARRRRG